MRLDGAARQCAWRLEFNSHHIHAVWTTEQTVCAFCIILLLSQYRKDIDQQLTQLNTPKGQIPQSSMQSVATPMSLVSRIGVQVPKPVAATAHVNFDNDQDEWERTDMPWTRDIKKAMKQYLRPNSCMIH